jgi:uncharacterized protein YjbI with pentapeptide repeats
MADPEDMKRLKSGEADLSKCDFRKADVSSLDLSNRNFDGCLLDGVIANGTNFSGSTFVGASLTQLSASAADFSNCDLKAHSLGNVTLNNAILKNTDFRGRVILKCNFDGADLSGANFSNANFMRDNTFEGAVVDDATAFQAAIITRAPARLPIFKNYEFKGGRLHRKEKLEKTQTQPVIYTPRTEKNLHGIDSVEAKLLSNPVGIALQAEALSLLMLAKIEELQSEKPNDEVQLGRHNDYVEFLQVTANKLGAISKNVQCFTEQTNEDENSAALQGTANEIVTLHDEMNRWWNKNKKSLVNWGSKLGLLGVGQAFLVACGAPPGTAFLVNAFILEGHSVRNVITRDKDE